MNKYFHTIKALIKTFSPYNYKILLKKEKGPKKKKKKPWVKKNKKHY